MFLQLRDSQVLDFLILYHIELIPFLTSNDEKRIPSKDTCVWRIKNILKLKFLSFIPFSNYLMTKFVPTLQENEEAQNFRDDYIFKCIERSKEEIRNGGNAKDMISLMLREKDESGNPIFPTSEIRSQGMV